MRITPAIIVPQWVNFTPVMKIGGSSTGIVYSNQSGRYKEVNGDVFLTIQLIVTSIGALTGNVTLDAPVPAATVDAADTMVLAARGRFFTSDVYGIHAVTSGTSLVLTTMVPTGFNALTHDKLAPPTAINIAGVYRRAP
jgi:hypothetical protein